MEMKIQSTQNSLDFKTKDDRLQSDLQVESTNKENDEEKNKDDNIEEDEKEVNVKETEGGENLDLENEIETEKESISVE